MKKNCLVFLMMLAPMLVFAEAEITGKDMLTILKAIGAIIGVLLLPGIFIGIICAGIRTLRGLLGI